MGGAELRALVPTNMALFWIPGAVEFQGWPQIIFPNFPGVVEQASECVPVCRVWQNLMRSRIRRANFSHVHREQYIFYTRIPVHAHREAQY